ncbi:sulfurtransferase [Ectothiorhodospiraceae bacterium WFHF3C12]|nr:sulfurtransferase [Ectothiorhodospiraceae bacterium WFHF3C12]
MNTLIRFGFSLLAAVTLATTAGAAPGPLVESDWLKDNLQRDDLVVLDVRSAIDGTDRGGFESGHIPGAVYSSYTGDQWRVSENGVPGKLPPVQSLESLISGLGIDNQDTVVVVPAGVGETDFGSAARVYWTFKVLGHDRVTILNGGHAGWVETGGEIEKGWNAPQNASFQADFRPELLATLEEVKQAGDGSTALVDARPEPFFEGDKKHPAARAAGTIPGAVNLPHEVFVQKGTARFIDTAAVESRIAEAELDKDASIVSFCNTGHWAATTWFALSEIGGYSNVTLYDGSMVEWSADESRPLQVAKRGLSRILDYFTN